MYTREIHSPRSSPIENGKPLSGTWTRAFEKVDMLGIQRPFSFPLPKWIRESRIKEWQSFTMQDDSFFLALLLFNFKYFREIWVQIYDKAAKKHICFKKLLPFSGWNFPKTLANTAIESRTRRFFFRIHNWLDANTIKVDMDIKADKKWPPFTAHLHYNLNKKVVTPMAVNLLFSERRAMYAYKTLSPVRGDIVFGGQHQTMDPGKTSGTFCDGKGFFPYRMHTQCCQGYGFDSLDRRIGFSVAEAQTKETYKNNENAFWVNGKLTPLPPVMITVLDEVGSDWIIQDLEGMVDLTFSPKTEARDASNFFVLRSEYDAFLGFYNGMLLTSEGEKIPVYNLWGFGEKLYMRV
jgi:hypothetical protein